MRRIALWLASTVVALVLLFSYRTSTMGAGGATAVAQAPEAGGTAPTAGAAGSDGAADAAGSKTYDGTVVQTRWGPVQVRITVSGGQIVEVAVPTYPNANRRDKEINDRALPILRRATLGAQSADIDTVSGATVTSEGYKESLQAAIDAAHLS